MHAWNGPRGCALPHCHVCGLQGFFGADCGNEAARLAFDTPLQRVDAAFEYDFFQLPDLNPSALTHSIEVQGSPACHPHVHSAHHPWLRGCY